ncbi:hypothetical protein [Neobacillus drentensis]|nr:hypothetical protein [Neobacillus drentensis]MDR7238101.1 hypothetical protein [Neobacillus drentensis]
MDTFQQSGPKATQMELSYSIHPHPTLNEILGEAILDSEGIPIHI